MNKTKNFMKKIGEYLRELSVVVIGIAITVSIGIWVNNRSNERDLNLYLDTIKLELEQNISEIEGGMELMQESAKYADYLRTTDKESLNYDTIKNYTFACYYVQTNTYKTSAFEMFKVSGTMRLMNEQELLLSVWDAYTSLYDLKTMLDWIFQIKLEEVRKDHPMIVEGRKDFIPMYTFFVVTDWAYELPRISGETIAILKEAVSKLEKRK